jgi:hypothetical protein
MHSSPTIMRTCLLRNPHQPIPSPIWPGSEGLVSNFSRTLWRSRFCQRSTTPSLSVVSLPPFFVRSLNPLLSWPSTYCTVHVLEVLMMNASHSLALQVKCGRTFLAFDVISRGGYQVGQFMSRETKYGVSSSVYEVESYLNCL